MEAATDTTFGDVPEGKCAMAVMGREGDTKHIWDRNNPVEVEAARSLFKKLTEGGYAAFSVVGKNGDKGEHIRTFDPNAERIIFAPALVGG